MADYSDLTITPTEYDIGTGSGPSKIKAGYIINCSYSGSAKSITLPPGKYKLEVWGAQGYEINTSYTGGKGGYSIGTLSIEEETLLYLRSGGYGGRGAAGFNGGGTASNSSYGGGGGGSDIRIAQDSLYARVIVAGGGGGSCSYSTSWGNGGAGGGTTGTKSNGADSFSSWGGYYGTQTGPYKSSSYSGSFGTGGNSDSGGGGGWYGGDGGYFAIAGGGGSGYIYTSSTASNYPSGCLLNSAYYLTDAATYTGNSSFTGTSGSSETGHSGNGYCRITVIELYTSFTGFVNIGGSWKEIDSAYVNIDGTWKEIEGIYANIGGSWKESG